MAIESQRLEVGEPVVLTSGDSYVFEGPFGARVVKVAALQNEKVAVLVEIEDAPESESSSRGPKVGNRYWLVAKGADESLAHLGGSTAVSVHIAETTRDAEDVFPPGDLIVQAWGELRRA